MYKNILKLAKTYEQLVKKAEELTPDKVMKIANQRFGLIAGNQANIAFTEFNGGKGVVNSIVENINNFNKSIESSGGTNFLTGDDIPAWNKMKFTAIKNGTWKVSCELLNENGKQLVTGKKPIDTVIRQFEVLAANMIKKYLNEDKVMKRKNTDGLEYYVPIYRACPDQTTLIAIEEVSGPNK